MQKIFLGIIERFVSVLNWIAGFSLVLLGLLTVSDVIGRIFGRPILGTYETVSFMGVLVFGLSLPFTSWVRQHIFVDFIILNFPKRLRNAFYIATRLISIILFFWIGWNMFKFAMSLQEVGEVSSVLHMPFYPFTYILGVCCFIECLVLFCDLLKIISGEFK